MSSLAGNTSTTSVLSVGETETHSITATGDADWFRVTPTAGLAYSFTVSSSGGPGIGLPDPDLGIYDSLGNLLESQSLFFSSVNLITLRPTVGGDYDIGVGDTGGDLGQYAVSWVATDSIVNNTSTTSALIANGSVTSAFDVAQDSDWFSLNMTAGLSYGFEAKAMGVVGMPDPDINLRDALGNQIASSTVHSTSINLLNHNASQTGQYFIDISDNGAADTGSYSVRFIATDTMQNNISTSNGLGALGVVASAIDVSGDTDWFRVTLIEGRNCAFQVSAAGVNGLPDGDLLLMDAGGNQDASAVNYSSTTNTLSYTAAASGTYFISVGDNSGSDTGGYTLRNVGADTLLGTALGDRILGGLGNTTISGAAGNDWIDGGAGADRLFGSSGDDTVLGNVDNDRLYGGIGNDSLSGGTGSDWLEGDAGSDVLRGGGAADDFVFRPTSNTDTIVDFRDGADHSRILGGPANIVGLTLTQSGEDVLVGFGTVSIRINLITVAELTSADFLFA